MKWKLLSGLAIAALLNLPSARAQDSFDDLNGLWTVKEDGHNKTDEALTEHYEEIGIRLRLDGKVVSLKKDGDDLVVGDATSVGMSNALDGAAQPAADGDVRLTMKGFDTKDPSDDSLEGTFYGKKVVLKRDMRPKRPIDLRLPGDRPWVRFMDEVLIPKTAEDRESYHRFDPAAARAFLTSCQLYQSGYWMYKYMAGADQAAQRQTFDKLITGMSGTTFSPRTIYSTRFRPMVIANLSGKAKLSAALAVSSLSLYFSTAAGGAVRIHVTDDDDSLIYYITDKRANSKIGLCVMKTPTHPPLASSFGKWLLDLSSMPASDDAAMARSLMETMCCASTRAANQLSPTGRGAFTDYLAVMAIEDQRGVMFNDRDLGWGYNMTSGSFCALIVRALSHGELRTGPEKLGSKQELASQVLVEDWDGTGAKLQPGDCSYFDVLNGGDDVLAGNGKKGGNDFQEYGGMSTLKKLTTQWLREAHPDLVKRVETSLAGVVPDAELADRSREDIFHLMCQNFYDVRMGTLTQAQCREVVEAGVALLGAVKSDSRALEAFILAHGVTKSTDWAPRASGF
jgi:hypothetical protein